jgi:hypothetical protein
MIKKLKLSKIKIELVNDLLLKKHFTFFVIIDLVLELVVKIKNLFLHL